jgi:hypothetical protein
MPGSITIKGKNEKIKKNVQDYLNQSGNWMHPPKILQD